MKLRGEKKKKRRRTVYGCEANKGEEKDKGCLRTQKICSHQID